MSFLKKWFGKKQNSTILSDENLIEAGACPNCWGHQEYDGKYKEYVADKTKANINHDKQNKKAFINQFVETNISGIKLKKENDYLVCNACQVKYKYVPPKTN